MKLFYLDTNVILTRYAPDEPQHEAAKKIVREVDAGNLAAVTSVLTLVEIASVTSRAHERFAEASGAMKREEIAAAFLLRVASIRNLIFIPTGGEISTKIAEHHVKLPALLAVALEIAPKIGLKTLDNLHLAAAVIASRIYGQKIDYFATLDEEILKHREEVRALIDASVFTPAELVEMENL